MVVHLIDGLNRSEFVALVNRLETEKFAERCIIAKIKQIGHPEMLYIRLPNSHHGVSLSAENIDVQAIEWAVEELRLSVKGSESGV